MNRSENINELAAALSKAQAKIKAAIKDTSNPFFKSTYADLDSCWNVAREPLTSNGLCIVQLPSTDGNKVVLETMLIHSSGQWISSSMAILPSKQDAQAIGSVITYMRRYMLCAVVGISQQDDDGNAASKTRSDHDQAEPESGRGDPFNPNNASHKDWLRKELAGRKVFGQAATEVLTAMPGKYEDQLEGVITSVMKNYPKD